MAIIMGASATFLTCSSHAEQSYEPYDCSWTVGGDPGRDVIERKFPAGQQVDLCVSAQWRDDGAGSSKAVGTYKPDPVWQYYGQILQRGDCSPVDGKAIQPQPESYPSSDGAVVKCMTVKNNQYIENEKQEKLGQVQYWTDAKTGGYADGTDTITACMEPKGNEYAAQFVDLTATCNDTDDNWSPHKSGWYKIDEHTIACVGDFVALKATTREESCDAN